MGARRYHEESLNLLAGLAAMAPENAEYAQGLFTSHVILGDLGAFRESPGRGQAAL